MQGDIRGLGALLFDDGEWGVLVLLAPGVPNAGEDAPNLQEVDGIQKVLNGIGVNYMHRNENLIRDSAIEERRVAVLLEVSV